MVFFVGGEEAGGGSVFRRHVAEGGAVGDIEGGRAFAEEFDDFADDFCFSQQLGEGQHEVGRCDSGWQAVF